MRINKNLVAALLALALTGGVQAVPLIGAGDILFGEVDQPNPPVSGAPTAARAAFFAKLNGTAGSYGFEGRDVAGWNLDPNFGGGPLTVPFNNGTNGTGANPINATLTGIGAVIGFSEEGRYNTTSGGSQYLRVESGGDFTLSFSSAIAAFGFYGTDIGDFNGSLTAFLRHAGNAEEDEFVIRPGTTQAGNGALLFWGFASVNAAYDRIRFVTTSSSGATDVFGFDDFVVADASQVLVDPPTGVPEPASLALVGLALLGAAAARRRS